MSTKAELHTMIDELNEDEACRVRELVHGVFEARWAPHSVDQPPTEGASSWYEREVGLDPSPQARLAQLVAEQGTQPISNLDDLVGDFIPANEDADEFEATLRRWRREGGYA